MDLPFKIRWKLLRQHVLAGLNIGGHQHVTLEPHPLGAKIRVSDGTIIVPSPWRWKLYRKGWEARLNLLAREYGVGRHITLAQGNTILDVGANAGEFAFIAARAGARIYCAEPDPAVRACLHENIKSLDGASAHDVLFWKEEASIAFTCVPDFADSSVFAEHDDATTKRRATTIDAFCTENNIDQLDLIKCDAEGAEPEVLEGAADALKRTRMVAVDTGAERKGERTHTACRTILEAAKFDVIDETVGTRLMTYGLRQG